MKSFIKFFAAGIVAASFSFAAGSVSASILSGWDVNGLVNSGPSPFPPTTSDANLTIGGLTKGAGVGSTTTANVWGGNTWNDTSEAAAIAANRFETFTVQPNAGYSIAFTVISNSFSRSATGPTNEVLQYSTDGSTFNDVVSIRLGTIGTANTGTNVIDLSAIPPLQNVNSNTTITFRIIAWGASSAAGTFYINNANPAGGTLDFIVLGTLTSSGVAPTITGIAPSTITTNAGSTAAFTVTATGDPASNYWFKVVGLSTNPIPTATTTTLTLPNVSGADTAGYFVVLSNLTGMATSSVVSLTVIDPFITSQPVSAFGLLDGAVQFNVAASGTGLSYRWYTFDGVLVYTPLTDGPQSSGSVVSGSGTSTLTVSNLQLSDPTNFVAIATGTFGSATSSNASLLSVANNAVLTFWNFNNDTINVLSPTPYYGVGTATVVGTPNVPPTSPFFGVVDPADGPGFGLGNTNRSWGTSQYPLSGGNKQNGVQFNVSTVGAKNITVSYDSRATGTASGYERLQYTTNGTDWVDYPTSSTFIGRAVSTYFPFNYNLSGFPGVANNPAFGIRVVTEFQSTATYGIGTTNNYVGTANTYGSAGTLTYDIVTVSGDAITNNNTPPTISSFTDTSTPDYLSITNSFTVGDLETDPGSLTVSAVSLNPAKVNPTFTFGGSGASRTLIITPNTIPDPVDAAPILVTVTDGNGDTAATWFILTLTSVNLPPTNSLTKLSNTNTLANSPLTIPFTVGDDRTSAGGLTYSVASGNNSVIPADHIVVNGAGTANPSVTITPGSNQLGVATVSITVNDNDTLEPRSTTATIPLMVRPNTNVVAIDYFSYDNTGPLDTISAGFWQHLSGNFGQMSVANGVVTVDTLDNTENLQTTLLGAPWKTNSGATLYASLIVNLADPIRQPRVNGTYFALFNDGSGITGNYECRLVAATNGASPGNYRLGINNFGADANSGVTFPQDLIPGTNYAVVMALSLSNGFSTLWVSPDGPSAFSVTDTTPAPSQTNLFNIGDFELRESGANAGSVSVSRLKVGTSFDSVFPSLHIDPLGPNTVVSWNDPTLTIQVATNVLGPFTDLNGSGPYTNSINANPMLFFRFKR